METYSGEAPLRTVTIANPREVGEASPIGRRLALGLVAGVATAIYSVPANRLTTITQIQVRNGDTVQRTLTWQIEAGGVAITLAVVALDPGDQLLAIDNPMELNPSDKILLGASSGDVLSYLISGMEKSI